MVNSLDQIFNSDLEAIKYNNRFMVQLQGEKRGRSIYFKGSLGNDLREGVNDLYSDNQTITSGQVITDQASNLTSDNLQLSGQVRVSEPFGDNGLSGFLAYEINNTSATGDLQTLSNVAGNSVLNTDLSSLYTNDWLTNKAGLGLMKRSFKTGAFMMARLYYQNVSLSSVQAYPTSVNIDPSFNAILPFAMYKKRFKNKSSWFSMYRAYTVNPDADQLSPILDNSNPVQLSAGNLDLTQQYSHWAMTKYNFASTKKNNVFYAMVNANFSNSFIGQNTFTAFRDTTLGSVLMTAGSQLVTPENLKGQFGSSAFLTYGFALSAIKSNLNLNAGVGFNRIPSVINEVNTITNNQAYTLGGVLASNISEKIDFTISTESSYNIATSNTNLNANSNYLIQTSKVKYDWVMPLGITFRTVLQHQQYFGLDDFTDNSVMLWTAAIGKQLFKNKRGEIQLSVFDILGQNNRISQNFYDTYYQETTSNVLTRYAMLNFSYNLRKFRDSDKAASPDKEMDRGERPSRN